ncbi:MAG TPA: hypothetical protein VG939_14985, partial [Caulobacteraceae bacterium]|nr:hypothetical protein [Caulobacteraceae bacterium]
MDQTPDSFPLTLDVAADAVRVVQLAESDYRSASFLDERLLAVTGQGTWLEWPSFAAQAPAGTALGADFIFHMGHVGSTLAARLLGGHPRVFALREPAVLRVFAQMELDLDRPESLWSSADWERRLALFMRLYARVWRPQQRALVKATSQVSEIAPRLMDQAPGARAFLMYVAPEPYLATIL